MIIIKIKIILKIIAMRTIVRIVTTTTATTTTTTTTIWENTI